MSTIPAETFRRFFDYERDAHAKTLASLSAVPPEKRAAPEFRKAVDLVAHIVGARWFWLQRIDGSTERLGGYRAHRSPSFRGSGLRSEESEEACGASSPARRRRRA